MLTVTDKLGWTHLPHLSFPSLFIHRQTYTHAYTHTEPDEESPKKSSQGESSNKQAGVKREREKPAEGSPSVSPSPTQPPHKKHKKAFSSSTISEEEVKHYLMRRPITSKELVRKFTKKKPGMDKARIVDQLHQIIQGLSNVEKQTIQDRLYLSLKPPST